MERSGIVMRRGGGRTKSREGCRIGGRITMREWKTVRSRMKKRKDGSGAQMGGHVRGIGRCQVWWCRGELYDG